MAINNDYKDYFELIKDRAKKSRVYKKFQLTGLMISQILNDDSHKSLYIKMSQKYDNNELIRLAKDVAERRGIKNRGAYFMKIISQTHHEILKDKPAPAPKVFKTAKFVKIKKNGNSDDKK